MMKNVDITSGAKDWQIFQQENGAATIVLSGSHSYEQTDGDAVFARVVSEEDQSVVVCWTKAFTKAPRENEFEITLEHVPAGGLYRIETCFGGDGSLEWAAHGDTVFHIGVGDLYVIAGQSNSAGYGKTPAGDMPELGVHLYRNSENWDMASHPMNDSTRTNHEINAEGANPGTSPYLAFGKLLKRRLNYPIGLIQASLGGSAIAAWNPDEQKNLYTNMVEVINRCTNGKNKVTGILWYQGCSDVNAESCGGYGQSFERMVGALREELGIPGLPFLTMQLNRCMCEDNPAIYNGWSTIREAQRRAAGEIRAVYVTPTLDLSLSDEIHNSSAANVVIGERLGNQALAEIYKLRANGNAPDVERAYKLSDCCIRVSFKNVYQYMVSLSPTPNFQPFSVLKGEEEIPVTGYTWGKDYVDLAVVSSVNGAFTVSFACGSFPVPYLPFDRASGLPVLSFYKVMVEE